MTNLTSKQAVALLGRVALNVLVHRLPPKNSIIFVIDNDDGNEPFKVKGYSIKSGGITVWGHYKGKHNRSIKLNSFSSIPNGRTYGEMDSFPIKPVRAYIEKGEILPAQEPIKNKPMMRGSEYQLHRALTNWHLRKKSR